MKLSDIDVNFDFTSDTPRYWDGYWERKDGMGGGIKDPDFYSPMMRKYHQLLWSKPLPNGEVMELEDGRSKFYLRWKDFYFGSDSILASFRYWKNRQLIKEVEQDVGDYQAYMGNFVRTSYTIGGEIILPSRTMGINQSRGFSPKIKDRWDLTLECIRRYYNDEESPLSKVFNQDKAFFDLFVDFKGYVDFFFMQDCVSDDYKEVKLWLDTPLFKPYPIPEDVKSYKEFINIELEFLRKRNERIRIYAKGL